MLHSDDYSPESRWKMAYFWASELYIFLQVGFWGYAMTSKTHDREIKVFWDIIYPNIKFSKFVVFGYKYWRYKTLWLKGANGHQIEFNDTKRYCKIDRFVFSHYFCFCGVVFLFYFSYALDDNINFSRIIFIEIMKTFLRYKKSDCVNFFKGILLHMSINEYSFKIILFFRNV